MAKRLGNCTLLIATLIATTFFVLIVAGVSNVATAGPPPASSSQAYLDLETGKLIAGPRPDSVAGALPLDAEDVHRLSTTDNGLRIRYQPGHIMRVDLEGRFMHATAVTLDSDGTVRAVCAGNQPLLESGTTISARHFHVTDSAKEGAQP